MTIKKEKKKETIIVHHQSNQYKHSGYWRERTKGREDVIDRAERKKPKKFDVLRRHLDVSDYSTVSVENENCKNDYSTISLSICLDV